MGCISSLVRYRNHRRRQQQQHEEQQANCRSRGPTVVRSGGGSGINAATNRDTSSSSSIRLEQIHGFSQQVKRTSDQTKELAGPTLDEVSNNSSINLNCNNMSSADLQQQQDELPTEYNEKVAMMIKSRSDQNRLAVQLGQTCKQTKVVGQRQSFGAKLLHLLIHGKSCRNGIRVANSEQVATNEEDSANTLNVCRDESGRDRVSHKITNIDGENNERKSAQANQGDQQMGSYKSMKEFDDHRPRNQVEVVRVRDKIAMQQKHRDGDSANQVDTSAHYKNRAASEDLNSKEQQRPNTLINEKDGDKITAAAAGAGVVASEVNDDDGNDEAILFTSVQQLCYDILNQKLLFKTSKLFKLVDRSNLLCLFVFGRPGSNKGELAYELVEHSSLIDFIKDFNQQSNDLKEGEENENKNVEKVKRRRGTTCCPLYHYIDVSAIIVSNIDQRLREYNNLVAQSLRIKRSQQIDSTSQTSKSFDDSQCSINKDEDEEGELEIKANNMDEENKNLTTTSSRLEFPICQREASILSEISATSTMTEIVKDDHQSTQSDQQIALNQFGNLVTLSTKQRSILQMKLFKYKSCVTIKWISNLIDNEINRLERLLMDKLKERKDDDVEQTSVPKRIYLINLVPNQMNLFKSCLYLEQNFAFNEFNWPCWALKFERRTNIELMFKEKAVNESKSSSTHHSPISQFKLPHNLIRFPTLNLHTAQLSLEQKNNKRGQSQQAQQQREDDKVAAATDLLTNGLNEKLGPKYNENFAKQFQAVGKLLMLRYNPIRNYNYANYMDYCLTNLNNNNNNLDRKQADQMISDSSEGQIIGQIDCYQFLKNFRHFNQNDSNDNEDNETSSQPLSPKPLASPSSISLSSQTSHFADNTTEPPPHASPSLCLTNRNHNGSGSMNNLMLIDGDYDDDKLKLLNNQQKQQQRNLPMINQILSDNNFALNSRGLREAKSMNNLDANSMICCSSRTSSISRNSFISTGSSNALNYNIADQDNVKDKLQKKSGDNKLNCLIGGSGGGCLIPKWAIELELIVGKSSRAYVQIPGLDLQSHQSSMSRSSEKIVSDNSENRWLKTPSPLSMATTTTISNSKQNKRHSNDYITAAAAGLNLNCNDIIGPKNQQNIINIFHPPASSRPNSRSTLIFNSSERSKNAQAYYLILTKVAYANGKNQKVSEVKRFHHRIINYKSRSDVSKLLKIISKARYNLSKDLGTWLAPAITNYITGQQQQSSELNDCVDLDTLNRIQRKSIGMPHCGQLQLSLVTYTIRIDISQLAIKETNEGGAQSAQADSDQKNVYVVAANSSRRLKSEQDNDLSNPNEQQQPRPATSIGFIQTINQQISPNTNRPASSLATMKKLGCSKKHVRFKLCQAPGERVEQFKRRSDKQINILDKLPQHRTWIDESLFASCRELEAFHSMDSLVKTIKSITQCDKILD